MTGIEQIRGAYVFLWEAVSTEKVLMKMIESTSDRDRPTASYSVNK